MTPIATLYGRQILVRLDPGDGGDVRELRGLRVHATTKKAASSTPATCTVEIYNAADDSISAMVKASSVIELWAGYSGQNADGALDPQRLGVPQLIWRGNPVYGGVKTESRPPDSILTIESSDGGHVVSTGRVSISFTTQTTIAQIIVEALRQTGIPSDVTDYPATVYPAGFRFVGKCSDLFTQLAVTTGQTWYIRDGAFNFAGEGTAESVLLSSSTGMVGSPNPKSDGSVEVKTLLNPAIRVGGSIELQSTYTNGAFTVQSIETDIDSGFSAPFYMTLTCIKKS